MTAKHYDKGKPRLDMLPYKALLGVTEVLEYGAKKYGDYNWLGGMAWHKVYASMLRHAWAWWWGEDIDTESGIHHLKHCATNALFLVEYVVRKIGVDDRPNLDKSK